MGILPDREPLSITRCPADGPAAPGDAPRGVGGAGGAGCWCWCWACSALSLDMEQEVAGARHGGRAGVAARAAIGGERRHVDRRAAAHRARGADTAPRADRARCRRRRAARHRRTMSRTAPPLSWLLALHRALLPAHEPAPVCVALAARRWQRGGRVTVTVSHESERAEAVEQPGRAAGAGRAAAASRCCWRWAGTCTARFVRCARLLQAIAALRDDDAERLRALPPMPIGELQAIASALRELGRCARARRAATARAEPQVLTLQEDERQRIARELHDEFGQRLTALRADAAWLARRIGRRRTGACCGRRDGHAVRALAARDPRAADAVVACRRERRHCRPVASAAPARRPGAGLEHFARATAALCARAARARCRRPCAAVARRQQASACALPQELCSRCIGSARRR